MKLSKKKIKALEKIEKLDDLYYDSKYEDRIGELINQRQFEYEMKFKSDYWDDWCALMRQRVREKYKK